MTYVGELGLGAAGAGRPDGRRLRGPAARRRRTTGWRGPATTRSRRCGWRRATAPSVASSPPTSTRSSPGCGSPASRSRATSSGGRPSSRSSPRGRRPDGSCPSSCEHPTALAWGGELLLRDGRGHRAGHLGGVRRDRRRQRRPGAGDAGRRPGHQGLAGRGRLRDRHQRRPPPGPGDAGLPAAHVSTLGTKVR